MTGRWSGGDFFKAAVISSRSWTAITRLKATTATLRPETPRPLGCKIRRTRRTNPKVFPVPGPASTRITGASSLIKGSTCVPFTSRFHDALRSYESILNIPTHRLFYSIRQVGDKGKTKGLNRYRQQGGSGGCSEER